MESVEEQESFDLSDVKTHENRHLPEQRRDKIFE